MSAVTASDRPLIDISSSSQSVDLITQLTSQIQSTSVADVQTFTRDLIERKVTAAEKLQCVEDILLSVATLGEQSGAVLTEAWTILIDSKLWQASYSSLDIAIQKLDSPQLKELRRLFSSGVQRKQKSIQLIREKWMHHVADWSLDRQGEHYLEQMACVAKRFTFAQADSLIEGITSRRLRRNLPGRGSVRQITTGDWQSLKGMSDADIAALERTRRLTATELNNYELISCLSLSDPHLFAKSDSNKIESGVKRRRYKRTKQSQHKSDEDEQPDSRSSSQPTNSISTVVDDSDVVPVRKRRKISSADSTCDCRGIDQAVLNRITHRIRREAEMSTDSDRIATLRTLIGVNPEGQQNLNHVCYRHLLFVGGHCGLQTKLCGQIALRTRLCKIYECRDDLTNLRTAESTYTWFRRADRPGVADDALGIYAYRQVSEDFDLRPTDEGARIIVNDIANDPSAWALWEQDGNLIVKGMFSWLWEGVRVDGHLECGIGNLIDQEFEMYHHHQREINGNPNRGWLRTMMYSLTQQVIRQDLGYWAMYVALRADRNFRLVSHPYYTKFAMSGDSTAFRHIDMNVPEYLESGRGANIIQGSVSLDDESVEGGCTEMVLGFQHHIADWWSAVVSRMSGDKAAPGVTGRVHSLEKLWTAADAEKYGDFVPVPCDRGDVRVTRPEILHGSLATKAKSTRRTILPWFVGVQADGETLDTAESGTWSQLSRANITQTAPKSSPSGHPNMYGRIPHRFPAAPQLLLDSPISHALACRVSWDDPGVQRQARVILSADRASSRMIIDRHRMNALKMFKSAFAELVKSEQHFFGGVAYFRQGGEEELVDGTEMPL